MPMKSSILLPTYSIEIFPEFLFQDFLKITHLHGVAGGYTIHFINNHVVKTNSKIPVRFVPYQREDTFLTRQVPLDLCY